MVVAALPLPLEEPADPAEPVEPPFAELAPDAGLACVAAGVPVPLVDGPPPPVPLVPPEELLPEVPLLVELLLCVAAGVPVPLTDAPLVLDELVPEELLDDPLLELLPDAPEGLTTTPLTVPTCWPFWPFTFIFSKLDNRTNWPAPPVFGTLPFPEAEEAVGVPVPAAGVPVEEAAPPAMLVAVATAGAAEVVAEVATPVAAGVPVPIPPVVLLAVPVAAAGVPLACSLALGAEVALLLFLFEAPPLQAARSRTPITKAVIMKPIFFITVLHSPFERYSLRFQMELPISA